MSLPSSARPAPRPVTTSAVRELVAELRIRSWPLRECGICGAPVGYVFPAASGVMFDGRCGCGSRGVPQPRDFDDVARLMNGQPSAEARDALWRSLCDDSVKGLPVVRAFCYQLQPDTGSGDGRWQGVAVDEDGAVLHRHVSSSVGWSMHDMTDGSASYLGRYPQGYDLAWLRDPASDPVAAPHLPDPVAAPHLPDLVAAPENADRASAGTVTLTLGTGDVLVGVGDWDGAPALAFKRVRHGGEIGSFSRTAKLIAMAGRAPEVVLRVTDVRVARGLAVIFERMAAEMDGITF